jgi:hypothetical protein
MMILPSHHIGKVINNIRDLVSDPNRDSQEVFRRIIESFEHANEERGDIVAE